MRQALPLLLTLLVPASAEARTLVVGVDGADAGATLERAEPGDTVEVPEGTWRGNLVVRTGPLTLLGTGGVLDGGGEGTTLRIEAPGVVVRGLRVHRSGDDLSGPDACIYLAEAARDVLLEGNHLEGCAFGIWVHRTPGARLVGNRIVGSLEGHRSNRGNGIQLFDADGLVVEGNDISGGRDGIYVSATENSLIKGNRMRQTRYGVHYMFSYDNHLVGNTSTHSGSGFAVMGSLRLKVVRNVATDNDEHGLLFRDVQYTEIRGNRAERNGNGLFFYSSTENTIADNLVQGNEAGAKVWAGSYRNVVTGNRFIGNRRQVFYVASEDMEWGVEQEGNLWGDYLGWDQDGDGIGDRPYRVDSFTGNLVHRYPSATLLLNSPALELLAHMQQKMPVLRTPTVIDRQPLVAARPRPGSPEGTP